MPHALQFQTSLPLQSIQQSVFHSAAGGQGFRAGPFGAHQNPGQLIQVGQINGHPNGAISSGPFSPSQVSHGPTTVFVSSSPPNGFGNNVGPGSTSFQTFAHSGSQSSFGKPLSFPGNSGPPPNFGKAPQGPYNNGPSSFPYKVEGPAITVPSSNYKLSLPFSSIISKAAYSGFFGQKNNQQSTFPSGSFSSPPSFNGYRPGPPPQSQSHPFSQGSPSFSGNGPPPFPSQFSSNSISQSSNSPLPLQPIAVPFSTQHASSSDSHSSFIQNPNSVRPLSPFIPKLFRGPPPNSNRGNFLGSLRGKYGQGGPIAIPVPIPMGSQNLPISLPQGGMVIGDVQNTVRFDMDKVPKAPPTITLGEFPPQGYKMIHGEQQLITLKMPNTKGGMEPEDLLAGAEYNGKLRREDDPFGGPVITTKTMKTREKNLPDVGAIYTVNMVLQTPNISAPVNGSDSEYYRQGMYQMNQYSQQNEHGSPLDSQVKLLGKLFTELQRLKPPKVPVEADQTITNTALKREDTSGLWITNGLFSKSPKTSLVKPKVDAPVMAVHIQSYSVPEANSQDPDVLDSVRTFGLPGHRFQFGSTNEIINLMDTAQKAESSRIPVDELGNNRRQVNENLQQWVKSYINLTRKINQDAHSKGETLANKSFRQHQVYMPRVQVVENRNEDGISHPSVSHTMEAMDPKMFSHAASITNAGAVATYRG
jgi:hypothetical protein